MVFKDFLGNLEMSTSKLPCVTRSVGGYARVTATNLFLIKNQMSSNMMSCTEPVPSGTWQSSVLISVKLLMFQGDVLFLARICSYQCDIYLTCGHFGLKWHPPRNFVHRFMQRRGTPGHRGALATSSCIVLGHPSRPSFLISVCCSFVLGFFSGLSVLFWLLFPVSDE